MVYNIVRMVNLKMMLCQILFCALLAVTGINGKAPSAIVGGEHASPREIPYIVSLMFLGKHRCAGAIIDSTHILTAGHCGLGSNATNDLIVVSGTIDNRYGNHHRIKRIKIHENFSMEVRASVDLAMLTLRTPIKFNSYQKSVNLPTQMTPGNITATISGWGDLWHPRGPAPPKLWKLKMKVIGNNECYLPRFEIRRGHLCAKAKMGAGVCRGDSGGPLVSNGVLIGIASFTIPCAKDYPDVFVRIHHYLEWINNAKRD